jgi:hypothetical protein
MRSGPRLPKARAANPHRNEREDIVTDLYARPSREEIAARVNSQLPGGGNDDDDLDDVVTRKPEPVEAQNYLENFSVHLRARMRALGWDAAQLVERTGITQITVTKAVNGSGVSLDIAGKLAREVGSMLPAMLGEYACGTCEGTPPPGYACLECGTEGERL